MISAIELAHRIQEEPCRKPVSIIKFKGNFILVLPAELPRISLQERMGHILQAESPMHQRGSASEDRLPTPEALIDPLP
jgi:hypothetical protein